ncbi:Hemerythrin HHE cation binding domain-containing protein [Saccharicrinis carchari]|uniref:Hemerythrin HHE cation binding domain-containing protein n=1 Tax=Saccharicrinis carchari TaxID=1168039 RepID=A0A521C3X4_SACCC|nr:hemerythrin domain-containing protein [Saccharicrinis carchari]SMO53410.1 Hemerythrin HHE cation binding domain-containing protein [Saccharicrinis carchari]
METKAITTALIEHHEEMRDLVSKIKKDAKKFIFLKKHLDIHHELEEDLLLSHLNTKKKIKAESLESQEEHVVLNQLLLDLADFPQEHERWMVKFKVFEEILDHHLKEEEEDLFPEAEKILSKKELEELGAEFIEMKNHRLSVALKTKPEISNKS